MNVSGSGLFQYAAHGLAVVVHVGFHTIQLTEQNGFGFHGVACLDEIFGGFDGELIHHFQATGDNACGNDVAHRAARFFDIIEAGHQHFGGFWLGQQLHGDFRDHPKHAF